MPTALPRAPLGPGTPAVTLYIVTYDMRRNDRRFTGSYERDLDRMTRSNVIEDIRSGQCGDIDRVYEAEVGGRCADLSQDIAAEILDLELKEHGAVRAQLVGWLETKLGCGAVAQRQREWAA